MIAEGMQGNRKDGPARKFVLVSEMLKEQGVACGGLVGIGIAFVQDDLGQFVISHSVFPDASLRIGEILTHVDGTALSTLKSPGDLGRLMLGPQGSKVEIVVRDATETWERLVEVTRRPLPSDFLLHLADGLHEPDDSGTPAPVANSSKPGEKGLCAICGIMVLDNQLRARVDDGKSYVHYGCFEAMQPSAGGLETAQQHARPASGWVKPLSKAESVPNHLRQTTTSATQQPQQQQQQQQRDLRTSMTLQPEALAAAMKKAAEAAAGEALETSRKEHMLAFARAGERGGEKGVCKLCGIMVFDNQPRGRLGDGSGYVHSSCFEAMQTSATLGSTQETQTHAFMRTSMTLAADVVSEAIKAAQSQAQSQANPSTPLPLKESVTGVSPPRDGGVAPGGAAPGDKGICRICGVMVRADQLRARLDDGQGYIHWKCFEHAAVNKGPGGSPLAPPAPLSGEKKDVDMRASMTLPSGALAAAVAAGAKGLPPRPPSASKKPAAGTEAPPQAPATQGASLPEQASGQSADDDDAQSSVSSKTSHTSRASSKAEPPHAGFGHTTSAPLTPEQQQQQHLQYLQSQYLYLQQQHFKPQMMPQLPQAPSPAQSQQPTMPGQLLPSSASFASSSWPQSPTKAQQDPISAPLSSYPHAQAVGAALSRPLPQQPMSAPLSGAPIPPAASYIMPYAAQNHEGQPVRVSGSFAPGTFANLRLASGKEERSVKGPGLV